MEPYATDTAMYYHWQPYKHIEQHATFCHITKHGQSYDIFYRIIYICTGCPKKKGEMKIE